MLKGVFAVVCAAIFLFGCSPTNNQVIKQERFNRGGYVDYAADRYLPADNHQMRSDGHFGLCLHGFLRFLERVNSRPRSRSLSGSGEARPPVMFLPFIGACFFNPARVVSDPAPARHSGVCAVAEVSFPPSMDGLLLPVQSMRPVSFLISQFR